MGSEVSLLGSEVHDMSTLLLLHSMRWESQGFVGRDLWGAVSPENLAGVVSAIISGGIFGEYLQICPFSDF